MATTRTISTLAGAAVALILLGPAPAHGDPRPAAGPTMQHRHYQHEIDDQRLLRQAERSQPQVTRPKAPAHRAVAPHGSGYGWPVQPFHVQHPVRGFFGDPRVGEAADGHVESKTFHFGVDVSAPDGTAVYATTSGRVVKSWRAAGRGAGVKLNRLSATVELVAEAFDETPLAVPAPWATRPVT